MVLPMGKGASTAEVMDEVAPVADAGGSLAEEIGEGIPAIGGPEAGPGGDDDFEGKEGFSSIS